jgi:enolase
MTKIELVSATEILDSRGRPTVAATCRLASGAEATASVPSGASTGTAEAIELRDGDPSRYRGLGCRRAVANVNGQINDAIANRSWEQADLDRALATLDGSSNLGRLGANAVLAVSISFARACAIERGVPLYQHFADMLGLPVRNLPRLTVNLFSGGKHAGGQVPIQDVLLVPASTKTIDESLEMVFSIYQSAAELTAQKYRARPLRADEGGLAPAFPDAESMLADAVESIERAGLVPGNDVALAVDVATSHFYSAGTYQLGSESLDSTGMISRLNSWLGRFPIVSIEDGLAEDDWMNWTKLRDAVAGRALVVGDDLLCTNPQRIQRAVASGAADALLLKVNQIGTLTETARALKLARDANWSVIISARSGETEDDWLADLAVGWGADYIKVGSITGSERLAKYNRLLRIEAETTLPLRGVRR